jgi:hypothetical protein
MRSAFMSVTLCFHDRQERTRILSFHSDNGSEFINRIVARLLNKLLIEQTRRRPRHSNDNGLAETKNGAVIRKHMGYGYIPAGQAVRMQQFYTAYFNPYLNYHRECAQADITFDEKGRRRCLYRRYQTRWRPCWPCPTRRSICAPDPRLPRRLTTHRGNPQRHRSRAAHAAGETPTLHPLRTAVGGPWK